MGAGLAPTYYFYQQAEKSELKPTIDFPIIGKIGYNFKYFEIAFAYQQGLCQCSEVRKFRQNQIQRLVDPTLYSLLK